MKKRGTELTKEFNTNISGFETFVYLSRQNGFESREWTYVRKDGTRFPVQLVVSPIKDSEGHVTRYLGIATDITEQKQAELELKASRDQFQALVANIPGITYRCKADSDWTMLFMSGSIDPLSGYPASDFINNSIRSYASVIHPEDQSRLELDVNSAIAEKRNWLLQYRVLHKDGTTHWVEERGQAEYNEDGEVICLDGFILDITEEKSLKQQLLKLTSQLPGVVYQYQQWPDGRAAFPYASDNIKKIYGVSAEDVKHDATFLFSKMHPDDLQGLAQSIEQSANNLSVWRHQYRFFIDDNRPVWLFGNAMPERDASGVRRTRAHLPAIGRRCTSGGCNE